MVTPAFFPPLQVSQNDICHKPLQTKHSVFPNMESGVMILSGHLQVFCMCFMLRCCFTVVP